MTILEIGLLVSSASLVGIVYPHILYPGILLLARLIWRKPIIENDAYQPNLDILICAYNEEQLIRDCLTLTLSANYPPDKIRVLVANDGSTDATASIVDELAKDDPRVILVNCNHGGKNTALDRLISIASSEVLVFMDADVMINPDAIQHLVRRLADTTVGAVISRLEFDSQDVGGNSVAAGESLYGVIERLINTAESDIHSTVLSNGALYAVRREHVFPINNPKVADDYLMVLRVLSDGMRVIYEPSAIVKQVRANTMEIEFHRTTRTVSSGIVTMMLKWRLLLPTNGWPAFFLWSHRMVRWASPVFLVTLFVSTWLTLSEPLVFGVLFYGQFTVYALALLGRAARMYGQLVPVASTFEYFVAMNISMLLGLQRFVLSRASDSWAPGKN